VRIAFNPSPKPTIGIEVELELIDLRTGQLASHSTEILTELGKAHEDGVHPKAKHELFESCIEIITGVCDTVGQARLDLEETLNEVRQAAGARGLTVVCSGSHPFSLWSEQSISPNERYESLVHEMAWMARRLQIFGVHVHVGVRSPDKAITITNAIGNHIGHFLALSASSPFWEGHDTGLASARSKVFEGLPTAGLPANVANWEQFEQYMTTLVAAGAISTVREVWWDVRPHPDFGTVELRMCDGLATLAEVASIAALAQCLVVHVDRLDDHGNAPQRHKDWVMGENKWRAARHGLDAQLIVDEQGTTMSARDAIAELVRELEPISVELGCAAELNGVLTIIEHGPGYARQREASEGGTNLWAVVDMLARELSTGVIGG